MITTTHFEKAQIERHTHAIGARRVLEIGAFQGETTRVLAEAVAEREGRVVVIDPMRWSSEILRNGVARHLTVTFPRVVGALERLVDRASYETAFWRNVGPRHRARVHLYRGLSSDEELLHSVDPNLAAFDMVFVDGDHGYAGAKLDLDRWGSRVRKGGIVLVHDATPRFPGVVRALREWDEDPRVHVEWPSRDSLCVVHVLENLGLAASPPRDSFGGAIAAE